MARGKRCPTSLVDEIGFDDEPPMEEVGAFLAAFHEVTAATTGGTAPRPSGMRLGHLARLVDWDGAAVTMGSPEGVDQLKALLERFVIGLEAVGYRELARYVVHGDPTTFNVLAHGDPLHPSGLIDLELADVEPVVADIGFCLWRSGRPAQAAQQLDLSKVRARAGLADARETNPPHHRRHRSHRPAALAHSPRARGDRGDQTGPIVSPWSMTGSACTAATASSCRTAVGSETVTSC